MAEVSVVPLTGFALDPAAGLVRDYTRPEGNRPEKYLERYDRLTLVYDAFRSADGRQIILNAPPMLNLWAPFKAGLRAGGQPVIRIKRHVWKRTDQIRIPAAEGALSVNMGTRTYDIPVRPAQTDRFTGLNCLLALNKNNAIAWVRDWVRYNVNRHGAEGVVLIDNGSDTYPLEDLADALRDIPGLKQGLIYSAPFPYGPTMAASRKGERNPRFFQSTMLNLARSDALAGAAAVLSVDIDEIVHGPEGRTIFEVTRANPLGMTTVLGFWGYPASEAEIPALQRDHRYRTEPNKKCNRKWCIVPGGIIDRLAVWDPHQVGGLLQNLFTVSKDFRHMHCRGTTTGWKTTRKPFPTELHHDPALDVMWERYLPPET
ncbi:hypothetical protein AB0T83_17000 [Fluviibacterium sp. DFM31]|uniref:Glycosyltransferase family 2 protein n=1 Tax=Meridianimarinicoccus marinus TaxID=3231483 RepID=A0ABV3LA96_9RHOB